jgi:ABC-type cobalamin/Fe3+-siderophores transport system ATPase subunit
VKKITSIHLQRFRQFADTKIAVRDFNLLVGPNNCGKTSILHAIKSFFLLMHGHVAFDGNPPKPNYHRRFLSGAEEIAPTPDTRELWFNLQTGKPISITITFDDDISFTLSLRQQFGQIHVSADNLPEGITSSTIKSYLGLEVAYIPGLVGVLVSEPYSTGARRNALASQGRYSEIFRSSLHQLKTKDEELIKSINEWLSLLFGKSISAVDFNPERDEYVTVRYDQNGASFDVVSSGAGLQQVIQMLTYLYISKPNILLIDEPDAHLHSKLQSRLGELFKKVAADLNAQVFLSTHSLDLIDTFSTEDVIVIDSTKKELSPIGDDKELVSTLIDSDIIDVSALSRLLSSRKLVVVEDKDQTVMKAIDRSCGSPLYSSKSDSYVISAKGVSNFRAVADLGHVLSELTGSAFDITFVQDRDGMPDFIVDKFISSQSEDGIKAYLLERHEIENYLIEPSLVAAALASSGISLDTARIGEIIVESAQSLKAEARQASMKCAELVNRHLQSGKLKDKELEIEVHRWFDQLDISRVDVVQKVFPGKELLAKVIEKVNEQTGGALTRGKLVSEIEESVIAHDITDFLKGHALGEEGDVQSITRRSSGRRKRRR